VGSDRAFQLVQRASRDIITRWSRDGKTTFFDTADFTWTQDLESQWKTIRRELDDVLADRSRVPNFQDVSSPQAVLTDDDDWKTLVFYVYGHRIARNCDRCPETERILRKIPGMKVGMFSILAPRKHIPAHGGPSKNLLRGHLGLKVPAQETACRIRVGSDVRYWSEGKVLIFDDTHDHEVWNDTDEERVVLFFDVLRPLPLPFSLVNRAAVWVIGSSEFADEIRRNAPMS
jgi:beta-hydroxylase